MLDVCLTDKRVVCGIKAVASDGQYLYILTHRGLHKVGTGYGETILGHVYFIRKDSFKDKKGWLGYGQVTLSDVLIYKVCVYIQKAHGSRYECDVYCMFTV